jgi:hypothetical protein
VRTKPTFDWRRLSGHLRLQVMHAKSNVAARNSARECWISGSLITRDFQQRRVVPFLQLQSVTTFFSSTTSQIPYPACG